MRPTAPRICVSLFREYLPELLLTKPGRAFCAVVVYRPKHRALAAYSAAVKLQSHMQAGLAKRVEVQFRAALALRDQQVGAAVVVQVAHGAASLLAENLDAASVPEHAREPARPVAEQQHTLAGIHPVILHSHRKKVLAEEHVLVSVAVEVGHGRAVDRRELRLDRQRPGFKCPGAIEQQHRGEVRRLEQFGPGQLTGENLLKRRS